METLALQPSPMVVKSIIQNHKNVYTLPTNVPLADIGYNHDELLDLSRRLYRQFRANIELKFNDDVNSISNKLFEKLNP